MSSPAPSSSPATTGIFTSAAWRTLDAAAQAACARLERLPDAGWPPEELRPGAETLRTALEQASVGSPVTLGELAPTLPLRRLLDMMRREFIERTRGASEGDEPVDLPEAFGVLEAFERVQTALERD